MNLRAVILEDEPVAQNRLLRLLDDEQDVVVVGTATTAGEATMLASTHTPDVLFVDVRLPGKSGVEFVRTLSPRPAIVFTTAHTDYAVEAFDQNAVDYLLKPFTADRLRRAMDRVRRTIAAGGAVRPAAAPLPSSRIAVRKRSEIVFVQPADVTWVAAEGNYCRLYAGGASYLVRQLLGDFASRMDGRFVRVHRSALVNADHVRRITGTRELGYSIVLADGTSVSVGDSYVRALRSLARRVE